MLASRSWAAIGSAGTNMCIAKVPLKVISTRSQSDGRCLDAGLSKGLLVTMLLMLQAETWNEAMLAGQDLLTFAEYAYWILPSGCNTG